MTAPIERLRAVLADATPGPWEIEREELSDLFDDEAQETAFPLTIGPIGSWEPVSGNAERNEADARAIAALGTLHPALLAVVEAAGAFRRDRCRGRHSTECRSCQLRLAFRALDAAIAAALPETVGSTEGER